MQQIFMSSQHLAIMGEIGVLKIFPNGEKYENSTHTQDLPLRTLYCAIHTTEI